MGEYIDVTNAITKFENYIRDCEEAKDYRAAQIFMDVVCELKNITAADVAPVVHSRWGEYEIFPLAPSLNGYPCGNCGMHFSASSVPVLNYCPNCGAKMDLDEQGKE